MKLTPPFRAERPQGIRRLQRRLDTGAGAALSQPGYPAADAPAVAAPPARERRAWLAGNRTVLTLHLLRALGAGLMLGLLWLTESASVRQAGQANASVFTLLALWAIAAYLGWLLARPRSQQPIFDAGRQMIFEPSWTLLISVVLFVAVGRASSVPVLLPLHLLWFGYLLAWNALAQRVLPPLRVGVSWPADGGPTDVSPLVMDRRVRYVPLAEQPGLLLSRVDAVLTHPQVIGFTDHQRILQHAQVTKVPILSKRLLDEELSGKVSLDMINRDWLDALDFQSRYAPIKRVADVLATLLFLPVLLPLLLIVALVVRLNSGTPVLFWQERVGKDGKTFNIAKFRTMTTDSERSGPAFASLGDQRVTPVGRFLRKFRLDELPQFWNVLRGEMSIIGPRPEQWAFAADFEENIPLYACRHWVRPGITGWAQVNQGYTDNMGQTVEKLQYDFYYVKHVSLALDLVIVGKTIHTILHGFGSR